MHFQPPRPKNDDERILPLINVVFLLLIFFMLAGKLSASDPFKVAPPQSVSEASVDARDLVIALGPDGQLAFNGTLLDETSLKQAVADKLKVEPAPRFWLKADGQSNATRLITVMELLQASGVERLKLLTVSKAREGTPQ